MKKLNKKNLVDIFKVFHLIKSSQEILIERYHPEDLMRCPIHFCLGQEALASAASLFLRNEDYLLSHHRSHGYFLAKGCPVDSMVSEFYGKKSGSNSGLAGSQELSFSSKNFFSGTILSGMFSISLGTAFNNKLKNKGITLTVIGDGGMEEGIVYETLNIASLRKLPIIFICENNNFSVHTNIKERTNLRNFKKIVEAFGINYQKISTHKIDNIFETVRNSFNLVRSGKGPVFIEYDTMRTCAHVGPESDDNEYNYRKKYLNEWKNKSSFKYLCGLIKKMRINKKVIDDIEKNNIKKINKAIDSALKDKFLDFNSSLKCNFVTSYSKIIKKFTNKKLNFKTGQKDTKLAPY